jgi:hypothetical protein
MTLVGETSPDAQRNAAFKAGEARAAKPGQ